MSELSAEVAAEEAEMAESFLRGLLDAFDTDYSIERRPAGDELTEFSVEGGDFGLLIGHRGATLAAVQELTRTVVQRTGPGPHLRLVVDISGYRQKRREALERFAAQVASEVVTSGVPRVLEPMRSADRKVVHDTINAVEGVSTSSEGEEPRRRVVVTPTSPPS